MKTLKQVMMSHQEEAEENKTESEPIIEEPKKK